MSPLDAKTAHIVRRHDNKSTKLAASLLLLTYDVGLFHLKS